LGRHSDRTIIGDGRHRISGKTVTRYLEPRDGKSSLASIVALLFVLAPLLAEAQAGGKVWRVGILATANPGVYDNSIGELHRLGYVEGQNLAVELRSAGGKSERLLALAAELVRAGVDVIIAGGTEASVQAARQATTTIPIVIVGIDYDPIAQGYGASLARPGGNVTGVFFQQRELTAKRMELLREAFPSLTRVAILWDPSARDQFNAAEFAARSLGIRVQSLEIQNPDGFPKAFATAAQERADAVFVVTTAVFFRERVQLSKLAVERRLPAVYALREYVEAGGLMSYGANLPEMFRRAGGYVDRIFKGAKAGDLPMEQPTKFELVINTKTATVLGLTIPQSVMLRVDQVIE
jgi:putative tryptophan/tyrosine transport system substrate-binding protein